jgi:hypothetical protein
MEGRLLKRTPGKTARQGNYGGINIGHKLALQCFERRPSGPILTFATLPS